MGSIVKKIRKRATKFHQAMSVINKNIGDVSDNLPESFEQYDISETVEAEINKQLNKHRKNKNRNKAIRRQRRFAVK